MNKNKRLSLIIPIYNESASLDELCSNSLKNIDKCVKSKLITDYEIIFVDDGSSDASQEKLQGLAEKHSRVHYILFRHNCGKSIALNTGFRNASGDVIITMDGDLQDDPEELPHFLRKLAEGYDLVVGWKQNRQDSAEKRWPSKIFNLVTSWMTGLKLHDFDCGYKAFRREVCDSLVFYGHLYRYIPALAAHDGFRVTEIPVHHQKRKHGQSHYGFERYLQGFFDFLSVMFLTKFDDQPMYLFGSLGGACGLVGMIICLYLTVLRLQGEEIGGRPLLQFGILLIILGVQLFSMGFIGDLIVNNNFRHHYSETHVKTKDKGLQHDHS